VSDAAWLIQFIREQVRSVSEPAVYLAKVKSVSPLKIKMGSVELGAPFIMAIPYLLPGTHTYDATLDSGGSSISGVLRASLTDPGPLAEKDTVLVVAAGGRYIVVSKVVDV
jgi:hypothetical protein